MAKKAKAAVPVVVKPKTITKAPRRKGSVGWHSGISAAFDVLLTRAQRRAFIRIPPLLAAVPASTKAALSLYDEAA